MCFILYMEIAQGDIVYEIIYLYILSSVLNEFYFILYKMLFEFICKKKLERRHFENSSICGKTHV